MTTTDLLSRLQKLSPQRRQLLARQIAEQASSTASSASNSSQQNLQLVAYLVKDEKVELASLQSRLKGQLPDYMVPSHFVELDEFPRLPNGKIDHSALPAPDRRAPSGEQQYTPPKTDIEKQLVNIWEEVLNVQPIGIHDNFFEIGGDSILSIQIIAKARKVGIQLAPNQLFDLQSIAELALFTQTTEQEEVALPASSGPVPLTPIQHWFFEEHKAAVQHWNQIFSFDLRVDLAVEALQKVIDQLYQRHESLRLRFEKSETGWQAEIMPPEEDSIFHAYDIGQHNSIEQEAFIQATIRETQADFQLENGKLFQALHFECGEVQANKIVLIAHHLVIDNVSWQLLVEELQTFCSQLSQGKQISPLPKTSSYGMWVQLLTEMANEEQVQADLDFWQKQAQSKEVFPSDFPVKLPQTEANIRTAFLELPSDTTQMLVNTTNQAYNTRTDELLIVALLEVLHQWSGLSEISLSLERHGREYEDKDFTGTIGWFTSYFPLSFQIDSKLDTGSLIKSVKEKLRKIPIGGLSYGILRYLASDTSEFLQQQPAIIFNFLGQRHQQASSIFGKQQMVFQDARADISERHQLLEINAFIQEGQLHMRWDYSHELYKAETIETLIDNYHNCLNQLINHCASMEQSEHTPTDFPDADLSQSDLDKLMDLF